MSPKLSCALLCVALVPAGALAQTTPATPADTPAPLAIEGIEPLPGGLTADATVQRALAASSGLGEKRAELMAAIARIEQTTIDFYPQLVVRGSYTRLSPVAAEFGQGGALVGAQNPGQLSVGPCPGGMGQCVLDSQNQPLGASSFEIENFDDNFALGANLTIPLSDYLLRMSDAAAAARSSREAASLNVAAERARVETEARVLYYNWLRAHGQVFVAQKALERSRARLQDVKAGFDVGTLAKADVMRIEALVANSELALAQAQSLRELTRTQLAIIMSDLGPGDYRIGEGVPPPSAMSPAEGEGRALVAAAWKNRLELKSLDASIASFEHGESAARASVFPRLDAVGDATYANPNPRYFPPAQEWNATWSVGLVATWNVGETFRSGAKGDELAAQAASFRGQRARMVGLIAYQVASAALDLRTAQAAYAASQTSVAAADEGYRVTTDRLRVGRATTTDVVIAETELLGARQAQINARIDQTIAELRLRNALGLPASGKAR